MGHEPGAPPAGTDAQAWEAIYQADDAGWDLGQPSPPLVAFLAEGVLPPAPAVVAVPGCGTGHEVLALAQAGYQVTGLDFAPSAIAAARERLQAAACAAELLAGDALEPTPSIDGRCDWVFEQTFFCALLPSQRAAYAAAMWRLLRPGGELWAIQMRTPNTDRQPFDSTPDEFEAALTARGFIPLERRPLQAESFARRRGRETLIRLQRPS
ncbi:MAG: methyltransferase domain-containing protein [Planctomycetota bacterium]|jgi:SAM-dependent methyltransferase|nr:methyltransferase domain-containing protein [Planctomycetota bacterium]